MRKLYFTAILAISVVVLTGSVSNSGSAPTGRTGASSLTCRNCHGGFALNTTGGSVTVTGLPAGGYVPGTVYPITLKITHSAIDRKRWGFAITALDAGKAAIGTFTTTNSNAGVSGAEVGHRNAPVTTNAANNYTFDNLSWKAPATAGGSVTFYYVGVAANNSGSDAGDYVYTGSTVVALPITLQSFTAANTNSGVLLKWTSANEVNGSFFEVERSDDAQYFYAVGNVAAQGNSTTAIDYSYTDKTAASSGGNIFYRLKMIDKDGSVHYSATVSIVPANTKAKLVKVYPTLLKAGGTVQAQINTTQIRSLQIRVADASGKTYARYTAQVQAGSSKLTIAIPANVVKGLLYIQFVSEGFSQTETIIAE